MRKIFLTLAALVLLAGNLKAQPASARTADRTAVESRKALLVTERLTDGQRQKNLESFDLAWKTVRDNHFDPKLGGVDWQKVHEELRPRVERADSTDAARKVMQEMLDRLGHTHVAIVPAVLYEDTQGTAGKADKSNPRADSGFDVRVVDGEALVVRVSAGRPAALAGVRPGWRVCKIDGEDLAPRLARISRAVKGPHEARVAQAQGIRWRLRGEEGKEVAVTFLDGTGREETVTIARTRPPGNLVRQLGMPPTLVHFDSRQVDDGIGYFFLNQFLDPAHVLPAFGDAVRKNLHAEGFIIDLRGNGGGMIDMGIGMGGWFADRPDLKLGSAVSRTKTTHLGLNPRDITYQGPLAILVDELSASTSEILAGGLQDLKRARIFGTRTAGAVLPSAFVRLPNGDRLQYVFADYVSVGGRRLEGHGVQPDEVVPTDRRALLDGRDSTLEAAVRWIRAQRGPAVAQK
jgi:carboxyl-terminal processing protease